MQRARRVLWLVLLLGLIIPGMLFTLPGIQDLKVLDSAVDYKVVLALSALLAWSHIGASLLFICGLDVFKKELRRAYAAICAGLTFVGIALLQLPVLVYYDLMNSGWATYGGLALPYVAAWFLLFVGIRRFALAVGGNSIILRYDVVLSVVVILSVAVGIFTLDAKRIEYSSIHLAGIFATFLLALFNVVAALRVKWLAGPSYTNSMAWFILALCASAIGLLITIGVDISGADGQLVVLLYVIAGALYVKAGYAFNKIREY